MKTSVEEGVDWVQMLLNGENNAKKPNKAHLSENMRRCMTWTGKKGDPTVWASTYGVMTTTDMDKEVVDITKSMPRSEYFHKIEEEKKAAFPAPMTHIWTHNVGRTLSGGSKSTGAVVSSVDQHSDYSMVTQHPLYGDTRRMGKMLAALYKDRPLAGAYDPSVVTPRRDKSKQQGQEQRRRRPRYRPPGDARPQPNALMKLDKMGRPPPPTRRD
jgi:hypothetical protein